MSLQNIALAAEDAIAVVTLNRPERRNALSLELDAGADRAAWTRSAATARSAP